MGIPVRKSAFYPVIDRRRSVRLNAAAFDDRAFAALFAPEERFLRFSQKVKANGIISFTLERKNREEMRKIKNCHPLTLDLRLPRQLALPPGTDCFFTAFRHGATIFIACFADEARERRLGWVRYNFNAEGHVRNLINSLQLDDYPEDLRILLESQHG
jgi:hypothetical protein